MNFWIFDTKCGFGLLLTNCIGKN